MKRVVIIGSSCSGKSTLAKQLADKLAMTYIPKQLQDAGFSMSRSDRVQGMK
ncbi:AAA family ATPase [Shewanella woodyi]|uniref:AAA family ATPase n=1 Tax=Shewanella woodyi TaxID=60961 RepID=UPI0015F2E313|nr:AAA family ATPase [Shewanella woodyi]